VLPDTADVVTGEPIATSKMTFVECADDVDGADLLAPQTPSAGANKELRAVEFLVASLRDGEWHDSAGLKALAGSQGISERTLKRAAQSLDVEHERRGFPSTTWWRLPQSGRGFTQSNGPTMARLPEPPNHEGNERPEVIVGPEVLAGVEPGLAGRFWLARDGRWRSLVEEPPRWLAEVVETAEMPPSSK
jgi:hypothetical protein